MIINLKNNVIYIILVETDALLYPDFLFLSFTYIMFNIKI